MVGFYRIIPQLILQSLKQTREMRKRAVTGVMVQKETRLGTRGGRGKRKIRGSDLNFVEEVSLQMKDVRQRE